MVLDIGTSAFMRTDAGVARAARAIATRGGRDDSQGEPTRDPTAARLGALLPFGGYKGYGLGRRPGAGRARRLGDGSDGDDGNLFVVFEPDLLLPLEESDARSWP